MTILGRIITPLVNNVSSCSIKTLARQVNNSALVQAEGAVGQSVVEMMDSLIGSYIQSALPFVACSAVASAGSVVGSASGFDKASIEDAMKAGCYL